MRFLGVENCLDQPIYDTVQLPAAAGTIGMFLVPLGGILAGAALKTYAHTNLTQAGRLEKGVNLTIKALSLSIRDISSGGAAPTLADFRAFYNGAHINLQIGQISVLRMPAMFLPPGPCENLYISNIAPAATEFKNNHGISAFGNRYLLANPIVLEENEAIQVDVTYAALAAVMDVSFVLWGDFTRPVR